MRSDTRVRPRWYRSFYWRVSLSFVGFVLVVLAVQGAIAPYFRSLSAERGPTNLGAIVASDLSSLLAENADADLGAYLSREYGSETPSIHVVMKDGRTVASRSEPLDEGVRRSIVDLLQGADFRRSGTVPSLGSRAMVTGPVQRRGELIGMVVLPPRAENSVLSQLAPIFSASGTVVLVVVSLLAAPLVFGTARRRLSALERAAERLGSGDLAARAPEDGKDEIAHLARAFNGMARDLAERDAALRMSNQLRRQMLADVSHELRTPLTAMLGYLETLQMPDVAVDETTRTRYLATVTRETRRLDRLVRDLLNLARLENGVVPVDVRVFAIGRVFDHVIARHERTATERAITVSVAVSPAADQIVGDPGRVEQVVDNLFANALRHTGNGGHVQLTAALEEDRAVLAVANSGPGIAAEHLPHVFERFYKADASRADAGNGSGLGLTIAKAIVEGHGGTIGVTSGPGQTVFTVTLPQQPVAYPVSANL